MDFPIWYPMLPRLACREYVRGLEPELSLLWAWRDRVGEWREELRGRLRDLLALGDPGAETPEPGAEGDPFAEPAFPAPCSPDVRELECVDDAGFSRTRVLINPEQGICLPAWVCVPHENEKPLPVVLCVHSRGSGKDELVGLTGQGVPYASELAGRGYVTMAPDLRGFGERLDDESGLAAAGALLGRPLAGMQVWDLLRCVDYLAARPDVRPDRISITGCGMGATLALFAAAVDERLHCAAVCGGLSTYRERIVATDCFSLGGLPAELVPRLLRSADLDDVACLVAPRALMLAQGREDASVPLKGAEDLLARTRAGFELMGEQVKLETLLVDGGPEYHFEPLYRFLDDWLKL